MKISKLKKRAGRNFGKLILKIGAHADTLCIGGGIILGAGCVYTACKATLKMREIEEEHDKLVEAAENETRTKDGKKYKKEDKEADMRNIGRQSGMKVATAWALPIILGVGSVGLILGGHYKSLKKFGVLSVAYAKLDRDFSKYRKRVSDNYGPAEELRMRYGAPQKVATVDPVTGEIRENIVKKPDPEIVSDSVRQDVLTPNSFVWDSRAEYLLRNLRVIERECTDILRARGWISLNEVKLKLGINPSAIAQSMLWILGQGDDFVRIIPEGVDADYIRDLRDNFGFDFSVPLEYNFAGNYVSRLDRLYANE